METTWILIADAGRATVMSTSDGGKTATVIHELDNPAGRLHTSDIVSDRQGRVDKTQGFARAAMEPRTDPHEQEAVVFARRLAKLLDEGANRREYDRLILVAPERFLGRLKTDLGPSANQRLAGCEAKDLIHATDAERRQHLDHLIHPAMK
jgi:protein required for attachment to host cells